MSRLNIRHQGMWPGILNISHTNKMSTASSQCKSKAASVKAGHLACCVPEPACSSTVPLQLQDAVRVTCSNEACTQSGYMHLKCFTVWEEAALNYMKCRGRARGWNDAQRRGNVWTGKGYHLAFKACACLCGHGHLKKDLDWKPPTVADNIGQEDNAIVEKKKKKKDKANQRPRLNYTDKEAHYAKDVQNFADDKGSIKKERVAKAIDNKIEMVSFVNEEKVFSTNEDKVADGWEEENLGKSTGVVVKWITDGSGLGKGFIRDSNQTNRWIHACALNFQDSNKLDFKSIVGEQVEYTVKKLGHNRYEAVRVKKCANEGKSYFETKADIETSLLRVSATSPPSGESYCNSKKMTGLKSPLNFIEIEQTGMISFWCPITNHGTVVRKDGVKFLAYLNGFAHNQAIDQNLLMGSLVRFSSPNGTSAQDIVIVSERDNSNKYDRTYSGTIVFWNSVQGYGFVRSSDIEDRAFLFLGSFDGKVDVNNLYGRNIEFQLKEHENQSFQDIVMHAVITDQEYKPRTRRISESILAKDHHEDLKVSCSPDTNILPHTSSQNPPYLFLGTIVTFKPNEAYGFIRSSQVKGDVFFSLSHFCDVDEKEKGSVGELLGAKVYFGIDETGKKSMEGRNVKLAGKLDKPKRMTGIVRSLNYDGSGNINVYRQFWNDPVLVTKQELNFDSQLIQVGVEVDFMLFLNMEGVLEAHDVHLADKGGFPPVKEKYGFQNVIMEPQAKEKYRFQNVIVDQPAKEKYTFQNVIPPRFAAAKAKASTEKNSSPREEIVQIKEVKDFSEDQNVMTFDKLTEKKNSKEFIKDISVMSEEKLNETFGTMKGFISHLCLNVTGSQIVAGLLKRSAQTGSQVSNKIVRMLTSEFYTLAENKYGCLVLEVALQLTSDNLKAMLVEKMLEFDFAQFSKLWVHGCSVFSSAIQHLDSDQEEMLASILAGNCSSIATHARNHSALRAFLLEFGSNPCIEELALELEPMLEELIDHKYGWLIVEALAQSSTDSIREIISRLLDGKVKKFATNQISCKALETAIRYGTQHQQQCWIEEVCSVDANQVEKSVLWLTKHQYGYKIVIALLQVSANRQIHGDLKASILFKQEDLLQNQYGKKVLQLIKIEQ